MTDSHEFEVRKLIARDYVLIDGHVFLVRKVNLLTVRQAPSISRSLPGDPVRDLDEVDLTLVHAYWKCELDE